MNDIHVLETIESASSRPSFCACGEPLTIAVHDDAAWFECPRFAQPTRLPPRLAFLAAFARDALHDRRFVVELPADAVRASSVRSTCAELAAVCACA